MTKKKKITKADIDELTEEFAGNEMLLMLMMTVIMVLDEIDDVASKLAKLMSIYTMGYLMGQGYSAKECVEAINLERKDKVVN